MKDNLSEIYKEMLVEEGKPLYNTQLPDGVSHELLKKVENAMEPLVLRYNIDINLLKSIRNKILVIIQEEKN